MGFEFVTVSAYCLEVVQGITAVGLAVHDVIDLGRHLRTNSESELAAPTITNQRERAIPHKLDRIDLSLIRPRHTAPPRTNLLPYIMIPAPNGLGQMIGRSPFWFLLLNSRHGNTHEHVSP